MTDYDNNALYTRDYFHQEDICRLCWSKDASNELFSRMKFCTLKSPLFFKVQSCLGIDLSEDDSEYHPRKICEKCFLKIEQFNDYKAFCLNSNQKLNAILNGTENTESKLNLDNVNLKDPIKIEKNEGNIIDIIDLIDAESLESFPGSFHNFDTEVESFGTHVENVTETSNIFNLNTTESSLLPANQSNQKNTPKPLQTSEKNETWLISTQPTCSSKNVSELAPKKININDHRLDKVEDRKGETCKTTTSKPYKHEAKIKKIEELKPKPKPKLDNKKISSPKALACPHRGARIYPEETSSTPRRSRYVRPSTFCNTCRIDLKDKEALLNHNSKLHGKERDGKYRCFGCSKLFHNRAAKLTHENHMCVKLEYGFKCNICGRNLPFRGSYEIHLNMHRRNQIEDLPDDPGGIFKCEKCDERFTRRSVWHKHMVKHKRAGIIAKICETTSKQTQSRNPYERSPTYCNTCFIDLKDKEAFLNHKSEAHGIERDGKFRCFGCGKLFNRRKARLIHEGHFCMSLEFGFKCNICGRHLPLRGSYERHLNHHRMNKIQDLPDDTAGIFKCEKCSERFTRRSEWHKHLLKHKNDESKKEEFICETCGKVFKRKGNLKIHATIHSGIKQYKCDLCDYRATQNPNLTIHMRIHTNERPYACDQCPQRCVSASNLLAHKRRHLGIRRFQCAYCNEKFGYKQTLSEHIEVKHQKSQCNTCRICGAEYARRSGLRRHERKKHPDSYYLNKQKPRNYAEPSITVEHQNTSSLDLNNGDENGQSMLCPNNVQEKNRQEVLYSNVNHDSKDCELQGNSDLNIPQQGHVLYNANIGENEKFVCFEKSFSTKDGENIVIVLQEQE